MKTMKKFLSMAALALVGAVMTGCSSDDNFIDQQPANNGKTVTLTMSVGLNVGGETRALAADGTKTFAAGEKMAVIYKKTGGATAMAETVALKDDGDITNSGKTATFTVTLDDPDKTQNVTYVYPAAMVNSDGSVKDDALNSQDGTLASLANNLDYCTNSGPWTNGTDLPTLTLDNQFAILALTLKNGAGSREITSSITGLTVSDGTNSYTVSRSAADGPIYVAIRPTTAALELTATDGSKNYTKTATSREYAAGSGYSLPLRMLTVISWSQSELEGMGSIWSQNGTQSLKGVTIKKTGADGSFSTNDGPGKEIVGEFQFSSVFGKITKIEVTNVSGYDVEGDGWSSNVWTGNASTVNLEGYNRATNIVFTIEEDNVAVSGITLNKTSTSIEAGQTETLTATVLPAEADDKSVTWTTSNSGVATVSGGVVTAVAAGTATITASAGGYSATCEVTVTAPAAPEPEPEPSGDLTSFNCDGVTVYYVPGETWEQAEDHPQNSGWFIDGGAVCIDGGSILYWIEDGWNDKPVGSGDIIDQNNDYYWW